MGTTPADSSSSRRSFLLTSVATSSVLGLSACNAAGPVAHDEHEPAELEVSATEDLMREHGVLERLLLIYEESARRASGAGDFDPKFVTQAAAIVRRFIEDYHEKLEENFIFPRVETIAQHAPLIAALRAQHIAGRRVTDEIQALASGAAGDHAALSLRIQAFSRMYRPHAAREDTVVFPALRELLGAHELDELGEAFEEEEHRRFGEHGFEEVVAEVSALEVQLGIADLARFTASS